MNRGDNMRDLYGGISSVDDFSGDTPKSQSDELMDEREDYDEPQSSRSRGGKGGRGFGGGRRGGKGGGGGGGGAQSRAIGISKALSKILRHDAVKEGLKLDGEGYANVDDLLKWHRLKSLKVTFADIQEAVSDNAKQRFSLKPAPEIDPIPTEKDTDPSHWLIRANQGHSIAIESSALLKPLTLAAANIPPTVIHGTYFAYYPLILNSGGLKKMSRNHVHFSTGLPEDKAGVVSGMRNDAELLIFVNVQKSLEDGAMLWWISDNGVVLTEGDERGLVPTKYWEKVEGRKKDVGLLWQNGEEVAPLPESAKGARAPHGKAPRAPKGQSGSNTKGEGKERQKERDKAKKDNEEQTLDQ